MTPTTVDSSTAVVNYQAERADDFGSQVEDAAPVERDCTKLAGRLGWVIDQQKAKDKKFSMRRWSILAMGKRNHSQVSKLIERSTESWAKDGKETDVHAATVEKLARVVGVSYQWLYKGLGRPEDVGSVQERFDEMPYVRDATKRVGISEAELLEIEGRLDFGGRQPAYHELYQAIYDQWRKSRGDGSLQPEHAAAEAVEYQAKSEKHPRPGRSSTKSSKPPRKGHDK